MNSDGRNPHDPLRLLPAELVLRILDFTPISGLAALTSLNRAWHSFIDETHQDSIYSSSSKTSHPPGAKDLSFLDDVSSFSRYLSSTEVGSWKELCKRQTLLFRNWHEAVPTTREKVMHIGNDPALQVWRFKPDFQRRFILSTSQHGGFQVTDMDSGQLIWSLDSDAVRPFAHLEYQDGTAVWDREGNAVEVWRLSGQTRGEFHKVAVLDHDRTTRGFQLSFDTLCVVSCEGQGFVYDNMTSGVPNLKTRIEDLEDGAVGHLDQCSDSVAFSLGKKGYHFYDKATGQFLGAINPAALNTTDHQANFYEAESFELGPKNRFGQDSLVGLTRFTPPRQDLTIPVTVKHWHKPAPEDIVRHDWLQLRGLMADDEWGAGMFCRNSNLFVGISRNNRALICRDWRKAVQSTEAFIEQTAVVESPLDMSTFDLGGWLSVKDHRVMYEIGGQIYLLGLDDEDRIVTADSSPKRPSLAFASCLARRMAVPVSFMAIYDDCIMTTYTTMRNRESLAERQMPMQPFRRLGIIPSKAIRILSFAPEGDNEHEADEEVDDGEQIREEDVDFEAMFEQELIDAISHIASDGEDDSDGEVEIDTGPVSSHTAFG